MTNRQNKILTIVYFTKVRSEKKRKTKINLKKDLFSEKPFLSHDDCFPVQSRPDGIIIFIIPMLFLIKYKLQLWPEWVSRFVAFR